MGGLTPEEKADFALLMQANESGGFVIEVGSNKHRALNRAIENEWVRLVEIDHRNAKLQRVFRLTGFGHWRRRSRARQDVPIVACDRNTPGSRQRGFRTMGSRRSVRAAACWGGRWYGPPHYPPGSLGRWVSNLAVIAHSEDIQ